MPEMPEVQAHAERLTDAFAGQTLDRLELLKFTALKTALPAPQEAYGEDLIEVSRRGKYLLLCFPSITFAVHLMQGGRLLADAKLAAKPRRGQARFRFAQGPALLLTEAGTERRAGVWALTPDAALATDPLDDLGPEATELSADELLTLLELKNQRLHGFLRDQRLIAGLGRRLANEICHRAQLSPFSMTAKLGLNGAAKVVAAIAATTAEGLAYDRSRTTMSASKERPSGVHNRTGEQCPVCGDEIRAVEYNAYTVNYCATCQTNGKVLADNTTSKFLK